MSNFLAPITDTLDFIFSADRLMALLIRGLLQNDITLVARPLVRLIRLRRNDEPVKGEHGRAPHANPPIGPFKLADRNQSCDMLIYVPRSLESYLIDDATGHYGYSHVAVDLGEVDLATGERVMVEATPRAGVHRSYLDKYGSREFIRIPLRPLGVDWEAFRSCIADKIGEPYDVAEVLTWGEVDDPAKQVCSDLAGDCLPGALRDAIVKATRRGRLGRHMVSIHGPAILPAHIFISPNGFAKFFGAPKGHHVSQPDTTVMPRPISRRGGGSARLVQGLAVGLAAAGGLWILWRLLRPRQPQ